ncbi:MAG: metallophosphoesterase [Candidatus Acidoferrum typicum]|nr:metallophosphoesterase [Candidatus Acidoferrum typicum]
MMKLGILFLAITVLGGSASAQQLVWTELAELPRPVAGYMAGVSHGKLLIIGGSFWENKQKHWSDLVQVFDPRTNAWGKELPLPAPRSDAASASLHDDIYLFGGGSGTDVRKDALVFHGGKWNRIPAGDLPAPRLYATAIAVDGYIYLLGGMATAGDYKTVTNTFWRWRPSAKSWEIMPPLPGPGRISHAMAEILGSIFVFGGATTGPQDVVNLKDAYRFDPSTRKWTRLADLAVANRSWWAVGLGEVALVLAGYTNDFASEVYWYSPTQNLERAGALPHGLADIKFFRIGETVVGTGGEAGPGVRGRWTLGARLPSAASAKNTRRTAPSRSRMHEAP